MLNAGETDQLSEWVGGAWARRGRRLGDGDSVEPSSVLWLTVQPYFADIRQFHGSSEHPDALDASQAFSGSISVADDEVTWSHDLDTTTRPPGHRDRADMVGTRDELVEIGANYKERWQRVDHGQSLRAVAELRTTTAGDRLAPTARVVLVDNMAIAIWEDPQPGAALIEQRELWVPTSFVGSPFEGDLTALITAVADRALLPTGWSAVDLEPPRSDAAAS